MSGWRRHVHAWSTRIYGPDEANSWLSWIGGERIAIGRLPTGPTLPRLAGEGVTHVVNCRAGIQLLISQDLAMEREMFGRDRVVSAPMWDVGRPQPPKRWSGAAMFAATALDDPSARVFIHCQQGRRRSVMLGYAVLRLRGHDADSASALLTRHRPEGVLVPQYMKSVERWLAARTPLPGPA